LDVALDIASDAVLELREPLGDEVLLWYRVNAPVKYASVTEIPCARGSLRRRCRGSTPRRTIGCDDYRQMNMKD
jgi:hypothetical protein